MLYSWQQTPHLSVYSRCGLPLSISCHSICCGVNGKPKQQWDRDVGQREKTWTISQSPGPLLPANHQAPYCQPMGAGPLLPANQQAPSLPANHQAPYCQPMGAGPLLPTNGCRPPYCQPITRPLTASQSPGPLLPANHQAPYCQPITRPLTASHGVQL